MLGKKAHGVLLFGFFALLILFVIWIVDYNSMECHKNTDCGENSYCSVGHECNEIPVITEVEIVEKGNAGPAALIALGLIGFAVIMRHEKMMEYVNSWRKKKEGSPQEFQDEPFYESVSGESSYSYETESE